MKRSNHVAGIVCVLIVVLASVTAGAVELGDPNVTVTDGNVSIINTGGAFTARLDISSPTALTGTTPIRMTVSARNMSGISS